MFSFALVVHSNAKTLLIVAAAGSNNRNYMVLSRVHNDGVIAVREPIGSNNPDTVLIWQVISN